MDYKSLEMLEFPKIRETLAGFTAFSASEQLALNLQPTSNPELVSLLLQQSAEARHLLSLQPNLSIGDVNDIREVAQTAAMGKVLEPQTLITVQKTLAASRYLRANIKKLYKETPSLWDIAAQIVDLPGLEKDIGKCIAPTGELLDSASTKLANLRHRLKEARKQLLEHLEATIKSPRGRKLIQEPIITEREGRYVIPIKAELRREVRGIVHDVSSSGATVFIEPWATIDLGNELRELVVEEKREVDRILAALSAQVGANEAEISHNVGLIAELDLALAKARYAETAKAIEPIITTYNNGMDSDDPNGRFFSLVNARHPLLKGKAVPLSVEVGRDFSILVITGPNTGGKTVALKTIGLLTLMAQAGMPIPASEESCIPICDGVFADIGDEQSIEQTLSSFSWHISNIVRIIQNSTGNSLVLLDELGTSTNPGEGAALAQAILLHFLSKGTITVATTHYSDLKVFAHTTPGLRNASLDFDLVTLAPTYHLTTGFPGKSNALAIASQLGLTQEIIAAARDRLVQGTQEIESLLADLMSEKQRIEALRIELEKQKDESENLKRYLEDELKRLKEQEENSLREIKDRLAQEAAELQKQIRNAASELRKVKSKEKIEEARNALTAMHEELAGESWQPVRDNLKEAAVRAGKIAIGDKVWIKSIGLWGTVISLTGSDGQIEIQVGHGRLRLSLSDIEKVKRPTEKVFSKGATIKRSPVGKKQSLDLDLRGKRAEEIDPELDSYLNDAFLSHFSQVCIIHGIGTGTVRQIVREILSSHPLVRSFRPGERGEGGDGVTIVKL
ncbi:endonuclease MutS2 [Chloroflexota bacterium]